MKLRACVVVLIGNKTASRKWVQYEIEQAWKLGKGLVGIYIHNLANSVGEQAEKDTTPLMTFALIKLLTILSTIQNQQMLMKSG